MMNELFKTVRVCVRELVPSSKNPRKIKAEEKRKLWQRLEKFGMISIPVRDYEGTLLGGKQRCELMIEYGLGDTEIDVRSATRKLTEEELREVMLIENSHAGEWDLEILKREFDEYLDLGEFGLMLEESLAEVEKMNADQDEPEMPIVAKFSEKYTAFVIVCRNEIDQNHIAEKLGVEVSQCYKSKAVGMTHVVDAKKVIELWK